MFNRWVGNQRNFGSILPLVFCGIMTALSICTSILSGFLIVVPVFKLTIDLSVIFLIPIVYVASMSYACMAAGIVAIVHLLLNSSNWLGIFILLTGNVVTLWLHLGLHKFLACFPRLSKRAKLIWLWTMLITLITAIFILLNGIFFVPLYWFLFKVPNIDSINFLNVANCYNNDSELHYYFFFIPRYWGGISALYGGFNLIKYVTIGLVSIIVSLRIKWI